MVDQLRAILRHSYFQVLDLAVRIMSRSLADPPSPPLFLQSYVGGRKVRGEVFHTVGQIYLRYFQELCGLRPEWKVLDAGCGIGRMAIALTQFLNVRGSYDGFDVVRAGIRWCANNITPLYPNFRFCHVDVENSMYNPRGRIAPAEFRFPYLNSQFDFVIMASVTTHMLPEEMEHYVSEVSRVLRIDGQLFVTFFLLNAETTRRVEESSTVIPFPHDAGYYRLRDKRVPTAAVAYEEGYVRQLLDRRGLTIRDPIHYGTWSGRSEGRMGQDILVVQRV